MRCWANPLGDCSPVQSREHYVSKNLWDGDTVFVEGFDWLDGERKEMPISTVAANILCKRHNEQLSLLDDAGGEAWAKIARLHRINCYRRGYPNVRHWAHVRELIDGHGFERWLAKTAVNLFCVSSKGSEWEGGQPAIMPPSWIVDAIYDQVDFVKPAGMYAMLTTGDQIAYDDAVKFTSILNKSNQFAGAIMSVRGFRFVIWLSQTSAPFLSNYHFRPRQYKFNLGWRQKPILSHTLKLEW